MADLMALDLMDPRNSCLPCLHGEHENCRGRPDGPPFGRAPEGAPCQCAKAKHVGGVGTCSDCRMIDYAYIRCGKPAKGTWEVPEHFGSFARRDRPMVTVERCGRHLAGLKRQAANDAKRAEESKRWQEEWDAECANEQASIDWCERLAELGIPAKPMGGDTLSVALDPERLYGMIHEAVIEMDEVGIEHRFHPREETT